MSATDDDEDPRPSPARDVAIAKAGAQDIVRALRPFGVLSRDALAEKCGQARWEEGGFDRSLAEAVREGLVEPLPDGFYRIRED